jgi:hypothetical protein
MTKKLKERENVTKPTKVTAGKFAKQIFPQDKFRQKEILELVKIFESATSKKCIMWNKIFGFGKYEYTGKSLKGVWMCTGFAAPKVGYTIYTLMGHKNYPNILKRLGKYKDKGKSCLFIKSLADIDRAVLVELIQASLKDLAKKYKVLD